jgi:membrane protein
MNVTRSTAEVAEPTAGRILSLPGLKFLARSVWVGLGRDDVAFYAAGIAFHGLFSLFAILLLLSLLLGLAGGDPENLRVLAHFAARLIPEGAEAMVDTTLDLISRPAPGPLLPLAMIFTLWTASNVIQAVIHALNRIYHVRKRSSRPAWRSRLIALGVVSISTALMMVGFFLLVFGKDLAARNPEFDQLWPRFVAFMVAGRQPMSVLAVFLGSYLIYWLAPSFGHRHRISSPGAFVFTLAWILATAAFNLYLREVAVYDKVYGPFATVVVVLVWVYLSAYLCLIGGEVNTAINRWKTRASG